jgi:hypothetical protein
MIKSAEAKKEMSMLKRGKDIEKLFFMPKENNFRGLCMTCNNAPTCMYPKNPERPVWHCEEFDDSCKPEKNTDAKIVYQLNRTEVCPDVEEQHSGSSRGLCANCENRKDCKLAKPESGIWHCNEYL